MRAGYVAGCGTVGLRRTRRSRGCRGAIIAIQPGINIAWRGLRYGPDRSAMRSVASVPDPTVAKRYQPPGRADEHPGRRALVRHSYLVAHRLWIGEYGAMQTPSGSPDWLDVYTAAERPELWEKVRAEGLFQGVWPAYNHHGNNTGRYFGALY